MDQIKRLPQFAVKDLLSKNQARNLANLEPLRIKVRVCSVCGSMFESIGDRTCSTACFEKRKEQWLKLLWKQV